ncbi:predicted protein [Sclerotinia sclerotiorum 1980 UF-70]|uniref:Uncharacterized protein n=2 Tax=Sclerotinia sclerotiorum (strain ATCC 18683 / 1980 / Ss-1) TaxID=665079 RepID=A7ENV7_SCLS1|nr:predicted protein [Sclerotinia sclerotiorum 1980 UF-70]APA10483.1 hypothetical protein sscle_06g052530 [Sclerotinia sclerotiorum 1980 UF-70]EDO04523.1 predicted protein [Sclerotinia sclerotiorum 1980 UF-70]
MCASIVVTSGAIDYSDRIDVHVMSLDNLSVDSAPFQAAASVSCLPPYSFNPSSKKSTDE